MNQKLFDLKTKWIAEGASYLSDDGYLLRYYDHGENYEELIEQAVGEIVEQCHWRNPWE